MLKFERPGEMSGLCLKTLRSFAGRTSNQGFNLKIKLSKEQRKELIAAVKSYFLENSDEEIGDLKAGFLLDFFMSKLSPPVYNQAIKDAQAYFQQKVEDLDGACHQPEERPQG